MNAWKLAGTLREESQGYPTQESHAGFPPPFSDEGLLTRDRMLPKQGKEDRKIGWKIEGGSRRPHLHIYALVPPWRLFPLGEESDLWPWIIRSNPIDWWKSTRRSGSLIPFFKAVANKGRRQGRGIERVRKLNPRHESGITTVLKSLLPPREKSSYSFHQFRANDSGVSGANE